MTPAQRKAASDALVQAKAARFLSLIGMGGAAFAWWQGGWIALAGAVIVWAILTFAKPPRPEL